MMKKQNNIYPIRLPKDLKIGLKKIADKEYRTIASVIRQAIKEFLEKRKQ